MVTDTGQKRQLKPASLVPFQVNQKDATAKLGAWLKGQHRDDFVIATKGGFFDMRVGDYRNRVTPEDIASDIAQSLDHLGTELTQFGGHGTQAIGLLDPQLRSTAHHGGAFRAGSGDAHHLVNRGDVDAVYLEIGDRTPGDRVQYPDDDLVAHADGNGWRFHHKDGRPYPATPAPTAGLTPSTQGHRT